MTGIDILDRLIRFRTVVGTPNGAIVDWIRDYLESHGARVHVLPGPEGDRANLFATIGPAAVPGYILSGHMDVVPANEPEWTSDPFELRAAGERLYGRGATDMKGFIAMALAAVPTLSRMALVQPIHLALSYDEEAGCRGAPHLIERLPELCARPLGAIIGEPSGMQAVCAHKGKTAARVTIRGCPGHSSRPDLGVNAIHAMVEVLNTAVLEAARLTEGPLDPVFEPAYSSLQVGTIRGGQAINIIPDHCAIELEARAIAGVDPADLLARVKATVDALAARGLDAEWTHMSAYPALSLGSDAPLATVLRELTGREPRAAVSYGTEAGLYQRAGIDAIVCGPGDIDRAHKPDEFILGSELARCHEMIEALGQRCAA